MHIELNDAFLRALKPPAQGRLELRDTFVPGLVVRVTANGTVSGSVRALAHDGKHTRVFVGNWPAIGIKAMRDRARIVIGQLVAGGDPTAEKRAARAKRKARAAEPTVAERLGEWRKARMRGTAWSDRYAAEVARLCTKHIEPKLGMRPLTETVRQDWTALIATHREKRPTTATWLYQIASAFLTHAEAHGWISTHPLPRKGLAHIAPRVAARERVLTDDELRLIWQVSATLPAKPRCFVRLLILTACRRDEAGGITFGELDLDARRWKLPAKRAKNKNPHTMPLCSLAMAELKAVIPHSEIASGYRLLGPAGK